MLFEPYQPGDRLRADDVNALQDAIMAQGAVSQGGGLEGFRNHQINATRRVDPRGTVIVRITHDVYPEGSKEFVNAYGPFNPLTLAQDLFAAATTPIPANAIVQVRNPEANAAGGPTGFVDDPQGESLYVTTYAKEPLAVNDLVPVYFDRTSNRWLPTNQAASSRYSRRCSWCTTPTPASSTKDRQPMWWTGIPWRFHNVVKLQMQFYAPS